MLSWLPRRRARIENIDAEAEALVRDLGDFAYGEARRRESEASSDAIARDWCLVALAVTRLIGRSKDVDPLARLAMNAVLIPDRKEAASREPQSFFEPTPAEEPARVIVATTHPFRVQFVGAVPEHGPITLTEVEVQVADVSAAIIAAANIPFPPQTIGLRIV